MQIGFLLSTILATYNEQELHEIRYKGKEDLKLIGLENAIVKDDGIKMRISADKGSMINFKNKNTSDEWSFEFTFDNPRFKYPEFGGIYMWYTDERIKPGHLIGIDGKFTGIMAGLEFLGKGLQIVIGSNEEKNKRVEYTEDFILHRDTVNPSRFKDVENFRLKVISTEKNFKIEVYDGDRIVYDNLRFLDTPILGSRKSGKYFGITTYYHKASSNKNFFIKNVVTHSRSESHEYDPYKIEADDIKDDPRLEDEIDLSSKEIQHLISNVEHMMAYLRNILGKPGGSTVYQSTLDAKTAVIGQQSHIREMLKQMDNLNNLIKLNGTQILGSKIGEMEIELKNLKRTLFETQHMIGELGVKSNKMSNNILLVICVAFILSFVFYSLSRKDNSAQVAKKTI